MQYNFWLIYVFLKEYGPVIDTYHSGKSEIRGIRIYRQGEHPKEGYFYLASWEDFRELAAADSGYSTWLVFLPEEIAGTEIANESCLMHVERKYDLLEVFSFLQEKLEEYNDWHQKVLGALLLKNGVSKALRIASEMLENPIALFDSAANQVDWCGEFSADQRRGTGRICQKVLCSVGSRWQRFG